MTSHDVVVPEGILNAFKARAERRSGASDLKSLLYYYDTWSLPNHPTDDRLMDLLLKLVQVRKHATSIVRDYVHGRRSEASVQLGSLPSGMGMQFESEWNREIHAHIVNHIYALTILRNEMEIARRT